MLVERLLLITSIVAFACALATRMDDLPVRRVLSQFGPLLVVLALLRPVAATAAPAPPAARMIEPSEPEPSGDGPLDPRMLGSPHTYRVVAGDSLWAIACRDLGSGTNREIDRRWREIYAANREVIGLNPDLIFPGQMLVIPEGSDV